MSGDSIDQWRQSLIPEQIGNWFPPAMVYLWMIFNKISEGPHGMLIFQFSLYFFAICGFSKLFIKKPLHRMLYVAVVGLFPPIFFLVGVIWKDVSLLVGIANALLFLFLYERNKKISLLFLSIIFFLYGIMVRYNGIICAIPYSYYFAKIMLEKRKKYKKSITVFFVAIMVIFFAASSIFISNYKINESGKTYHFENAIFMWDLWGMSIEIGKNIMPDYVFNRKSINLDIESMKKYYNPESNTIIYLMQYITPYRFKKSFPNKTFKKDFISLILDYPIAYMTVRSRLTWYMLGGRNPILPFLFQIDHFPKNHYLYPFSKDLKIRHPKILNHFHRVAEFFLQKTFLYKVWIYIAISIIQIAFFAKHRPRENRQLILILSIGLFYWLPYPVISPATDFRLSILTIFCSILTFPFFLKQLCLLSYPTKKDSKHSM